MNTADHPNSCRMVHDVAARLSETLLLCRQKHNFGKTAIQSNLQTAAANRPASRRVFCMAIKQLLPGSWLCSKCANPSLCTEKGMVLGRQLSRIPSGDELQEAAASRPASRRVSLDGISKSAKRLLPASFRLRPLQQQPEEQFSASTHGPQQPSAPVKQQHGRCSMGCTSSR